MVRAWKLPGVCSFLAIMRTAFASPLMAADGANQLVGWHSQRSMVKGDLKGFSEGGESFCQGSSLTARQDVLGPWQWPGDRVHQADLPRQQKLRGVMGAQPPTDLQQSNGPLLAYVGHRNTQLWQLQQVGEPPSEKTAGRVVYGNLATRLLTERSFTPRDQPTTGEISGSPSDSRLPRVEPAPPTLTADRPIGLDGYRMGQRQLFLSLGNRSDSGLAGPGLSDRARGGSVRRGGGGSGRGSVGPGLSDRARGGSVRRGGGGR